MNLILVARQRVFVLSPPQPIKPTAILIVLGTDKGNVQEPLAAVAVINHEIRILGTFHHRRPGAIKAQRQANAGLFFSIFQRDAP